MPAFLWLRRYYCICRLLGPLLFTSAPNPATLKTLTIETVYRHKKPPLIRWFLLLRGRYRAILAFPYAHASVPAHYARYR